MKSGYTAAVLAVAGTLFPNLYAQEDSRADEIRAERQQKSQELKPDELNSVERGLMRFRDGRWLDRFAEGVGGVRLKVGGLVQGAGFGFGPEYRWQNNDR